MKLLPTLAAVLALSVPVTGLSVKAAAADTLTKVRVSTIPVLDAAPFQIALTRGFFEEAGLDVDTSPTTGGAFGLPALAAGAVDFAFSNSVSIALGAAQGLGFKIISAGSFTAQEPPDVSGLVARAGAGITSGADLTGKRFAVNSRNNINYLYGKAWIDATGGDSSTVIFREVPFPQMLDAIATDQVDVAFIVEPFFTAGLSSGAVELVGWAYNAVQPEMPVAMHVTTERFLAENPEIVAAFVEAYNRGVRWSNDNVGTEEWISIIAGYTRLDPGFLAGLPDLPFFETIDPEKFQPTLDLMLEYRLLRQPLMARDLLHDTVLPR